jgi:glyoxylase-like metal-dependent hydrolase (beta-lactamase superfamily II)
MPNFRHPRLLIAPLFLIALAWAAQRNVAPVKPLLTEEGQLVVFDKSTYQARELTKRIPIQEAWPRGQEFERALEKYGVTQNTPEAHIPVPAAITKDVYLVGQDRVNNLTYLLDCGSEGIAVIDPTYETEVEHTIENVEKCGYSRNQIRWVLNTHCHVDHAAADQKFRQGGAQIIVHEADAEAIEKGTRITAYNLVPGGQPFPKCKIDHRLSDGEVLQLGNKTIEVIHTPGHTPGSASFLIQVDGKNLLFAGDTVLYDARLGWQGNPYADNRAYLYSLEKLDGFTLEGKKIYWDLLLPGHGAISMSRAFMDVAKARQTVAADLAAGRPIESVPFATLEYRQQMYGRPAIAYKP